MMLTMSRRRADEGNSIRWLKKKKVYLLGKRLVNECCRRMNQKEATRGNEEIPLGAVLMIESRKMVKGQADQNQTSFLMMGVGRGLVVHGEVTRHRRVSVHRRMV